MRPRPGVLRVVADPQRHRAHPGTRPVGGAGVVRRTHDDRGRHGVARRVGQVAPGDPGERDVRAVHGAVSTHALIVHPPATVSRRRSDGFRRSSGPTQRIRLRCCALACHHGRMSTRSLARPDGVRDPGRDSGSGTGPGSRPRLRETPPPLDAVSKKIIEQLQEDGRRPYAAIGAAVGLSEAAVRQRVQRLVRAGVVQIVAVTDPLRVGFTRQAMIGIRVDGPLDPVLQTLRDLDEVAYLVITAGSFDVLAEVICEDDQHLLYLLNEHIRPIEGVRSTETFVYLELSNQPYTWGTR